jgi:hypothetical protein
MTPAEAAATGLRQQRQAGECVGGRLFDRVGREHRFDPLLELLERQSPGRVMLGQRAGQPVAIGVRERDRGTPDQTAGSTLTAVP